jgi:hypothetical protein
MPSLPTFFFSYAREDVDSHNYLRQFFEDLEHRVARYAGHRSEKGRLGTIDDRDVALSADWDETLSQALQKNQALVALLSPLYFASPNCSREFGIFALRSAGIDMDAQGSLTGIKNVFFVRWMEADAYAINHVADGRIPPLIRLINDTPPMPRREQDDPDRANAIRRYRLKGMEACVDNEPHYGELLNAIAVQIRDMEELPEEMNPVRFATAIDAFRYDWSAHLKKAPASGAAPLAAPPPVLPQALASVAAFYITKRPFDEDPTNPITFTDRLIAESAAGAPTNADAELMALVADVGEACRAEKLTLFNCAANPAVPQTPEPIIRQLASVGAQHVLTVLIVDPDVFASSTEPVIRSIILSNDWIGPALVPEFAKRTEEIATVLADFQDVPRPIIPLPSAGNPRVQVLRRLFVGVRGKVWLASAGSHPASPDPIPRLTSVGSEPR